MKIGRLVLSRKAGQSIKIGNDVEVTIVRNKRGVMKLMVTAPTNVTVLRSELNNFNLTEKVKL